MSTKWEEHYTRERSVLSYPDENLVRMLHRHLNSIGTMNSLKAVDLGCGSGRHLKLLVESGISSVTGIDNSFNALRICRKNYSSLLQSDNLDLPIKEKSIDIAVAWGSLHYNHKRELPRMIDEIMRILNPGGVLFATLRSERDTLMKKGRHLGNDVWQTNLDDIEGSLVSFFSESELNEYFCRFSSLKYGIMERSIIGDTGKLVSHWVIFAEK
jgi:ubiquinone/menaquinone biosynthesis C-methylase UbiE